MSNFSSQSKDVACVRREPKPRAMAFTGGEVGGMDVTDIAELVDGVVFQCRTLPDGRHEPYYISDSCESIWGYTSFELLADGAGFLEGADTPTQHLLMTSMEDAIKTGVLWTREWSIRDRNGGTKWLRGVGKIKPAAGGMAGWSMVVTDITSRGRVDQLDESVRSNFRTLCDRLEDVAVHRFGSDLRVTYWNPASARMYGYSEAEAIGREVVELVTQPEHHDAWSPDGHPN